MLTAKEAREKTNQVIERGNKEQISLLIEEACERGDSRITCLCTGGNQQRELIEWLEKLSYKVTNSTTTLYISW